jgi:hypothetical protein
MPIQQEARLGFQLRLRTTMLSEVAEVIVGGV